jgi:hypothetical protein
MLDSLVDDYFDYEYKTEYSSCPRYVNVTLTKALGDFPVYAKFNDCIVDMELGVMEFFKKNNDGIVVYKFNLFLDLDDRSFDIKRYDNSGKNVV